MSKILEDTDTNLEILLHMWAELGVASEPCLVWSEHDPYLARTIFGKARYAARILARARPTGTIRQARVMSGLSRANIFCNTPVLQLFSKTENVT